MAGLCLGPAAGGSAAIAFACEALPALPVLEQEWRRLEAVAQPSFFTSWDWLGTWLAALPPSSRPLLLRGRRADETIAVALIGRNARIRRGGLVRTRGLWLNETGDPRFDALTIECNDVLARIGDETAAWAALLGWFAALGHEADELYLGGSLRRLPPAAVEGQGLFRRETAVPSYSIDLGRLRDAGGDWAAILSANARQQLRRAMRRFAPSGALCLDEAATTAQALSFFSELKALHGASWERRGRAHAFTRPFFEPFHRLLIERAFAGGAVQLLRARAGRHTLGYLYNFRFRGRIYAYQSAFAQSARHERPGVVTHALAIAEAARAGLAVYDFMAGHNRLKESFATDCRPMLWQVVQQRRLSLRLEHLAIRTKTGLGAVLRRSRVMAGEKPLPPGGRNDRAGGAHSAGASCRSC